MMRRRHLRRSEHMRLRIVRYSREQCFVAHDAKRPRLLIDRARRLNRRVDKLTKRPFIDRLGGEVSHCAPRVDRFFKVHVLPAYARFYNNRPWRWPRIDPNQKLSCARPVSLAKATEQVAGKVRTAGHNVGD